MDSPTQARLTSRLRGWTQWWASGGAWTPSFRTAGLELLLLLSCMEWVLWTDSKHVLDKPFRTANTIVLVAVVVFLTARQRPTRKDLGLSPKSWADGWFSLTLMTAGAVALMAWLGWTCQAMGELQTMGPWMLKNWHLEGVQQFLLQVLLVPRLAVLLGGPGLAVSVVSASLFSLLHAPNLPLMSLTLLSGLIWCEWFRRHRNLPALWISHLVLAASALYFLNGLGLGNLRVGIGYVWRVWISPAS